MKDQSFMWLPADPANPEVLGVIHLVSVYCSQTWRQKEE